MRKQILFILINLAFGEVFSQVVSTPFQSYDLNNMYITSGTNTYSSGTLTAPAVGSGNYFVVTNTGNVQLTASQMVDLKPGFDAWNFTNSTGYFDAKIGPIPITDAEVMGSTNVGTQYKRFEIGYLW